MEPTPRKPRTAIEQALLEECAHFDMRRTTRALSQFYDGFMHDAPIQSTQFSLLRMIQVERELTLTALSRKLVMDRTSVTRALEPLIRDSFVKVRKCDQDGRVRYVSLTRKGRDAIARAEPFWRQAQEALLDKIGTASWLSLISALRETKAKLRHVADDADRMNAIDLEKQE